MQHAAVSNRWRFAVGLAAALLAAGVCRAQSVTPPATIEDALKSVAAQAGVIFTGSVVRVTAAQNGDARIDFVVEDGLRGTAAGGAYSMRLSAWAGGAERFHVGERALFLLHAPSAGGYSSPVQGEHGVVPLSGDATEGSVDLRWLATAVLRDAPVRDEAAPQPLVHAANVTPSSTAEVARLAGVELVQRQSNVTGQDVHAIDRDLVTGMLRTWDAAARRAQAASGSAAQTFGRPR